jgi:hypothetical protein
MTKDVIVVAGCTHREGFLDEYEKSLNAAGIDFYLQQLEPLSLGANSITMQKRVNYFRGMAEKFYDYEAIFITDAWDVLFFGTKQELIDKAPRTFLCSAERNCYPESSLAESIHGFTPWRYANNGMVAANPHYLLNWCSAVEQTPDLHMLDQGWFNRRRAEDSPLTPLDTTTTLFYVVSAWLEDGSLQVKGGRPWNSRCHTYPNFLHFSGKCPSDGVRKMLEERT